MTTPTDSGHVAALADKLGPVRFAMFTTADQHGHLISHPMTLQLTDDGGGLWFYTATTAPLWENIAHNPEVNLSFARPDDMLFVSVSGRAERVVDRERIRDLWNVGVQAWFPAGPEDEHVVLVRVDPHAAAYWDSKESKMVRLFEYARAAFTGNRPDVEPGEHGTIPLD
ncbi:pyridoxamine 5'-phosphate oxidase family protein [Massilia solisilvae]|uniref:Pyridoxamine 5'-phosphate oxidase family protein n=1 Tax=Massilia solisilvae TaxID=1811225 RepID=A0ABT2BHX9_9BURK|nr:pyridoxamine 5'-phosphate oxidase family protein [Massilia solisilvae]MCS0608062.1 pyridoxamine 5'-phosphate oxidase family protein [Massilia solisilvae]